VGADALPRKENRVCENRDSPNREGHLLGEQTTAR